MDLVELQRRVSAVAKLDLAPHYASFRARGGADDSDAFLAYLGQTSALSPDALRELFSATDVDLGGAEAFAGTALGGFMAPGGASHVEIGHVAPSTNPESFTGAATLAEPPTIRKVSAPASCARPPCRRSSPRASTLDARAGRDGRHRDRARRAAPP